MRRGGRTSRQRSRSAQVGWRRRRRRRGHLGSCTVRLGHSCARLGHSSARLGHCSGIALCPCRRGETRADPAPPSAAAADPAPPNAAAAGRRATSHRRHRHRHHYRHRHRRSRRRRPSRRRRCHHPSRRRATCLRRRPGPWSCVRALPRRRACVRLPPVALHSAPTSAAPEETETSDVRRNSCSVYYLTHPLCPPFWFGETQLFPKPSSVRGSPPRGGWRMS